MKRLVFSLILAIILVLPMNHVAEAATHSKELDLEVISDELVDTPFNSSKDGGPVAVFDVSFGMEDNQQVAYTASKGSGDYGAIFNVIDVENGENIFNAKMDGATQVWSIITVDTDVYIGATGKYATLWKYDSIKKEMTNLGNPLKGLVTIFTLSSDGEKIYGGGHPTGKLFSYDIKSNHFEDLGVVDMGLREDGIENLKHPEDYVRSSAIYNGNIYVGTGSQNGRIIKKSLTGNSDWELIEMPIHNDLNEFENLQFVYDLKVVRNYLFAFFNGNRTIYIYDLDKEEWLDTKIQNVRGQVGVSSEYKEHVYFSSNDKNMYRFNLNTLKLDDDPIFGYDANLRSSDVLTRNNKEVLMSIEFDGKLRIFDFNQSFTKDFVDSDIIGQPQAIQSMFYDRKNDNLFVSGYQGTQGYRRKLSTGVVDKFTLGQIENMDVLDGIMYFGEYPGAKIFTMDSNMSNPKVKERFNLSKEKQDRPFKMHGYEGKMYVGSIGDYGILNGALAIYDPEIDKLNVYDEIVSNQSIVGIAVKDNLVYGSTTIHGGLGSNPAETTAKLFIFDTNKEEVILLKEIDELSHQKISMISGLRFDDNGRLWASANGSLFEINPDDLSLKQIKTVYPALESYGKWRPVEINFVDDKIYANVGGVVNVFDSNSLENIELVKSDKYVVTNDHTILYADQVDIRTLKFKIHENDFEIQEIEVLNHSFEEHENNIPTSWTPYYSTVKENTYFNVNTEHKTHGEVSLHIYDRDASASMFVRSEKIPVKEGSEYTASIDHYLMNGKATLMMRFYDDEGKQIGKDQAHQSIIHTSGNYNKWLTYELNGVAPKGASHLRIALGTNNSAQTDGALFDKIIVTEKSKVTNLESKVTVRHQYLDFDKTILDEKQDIITGIIGEKLDVELKENNQFSVDDSIFEKLRDTYFEAINKEIVIEYNKLSLILVNHHYFDKNNQYIKTETQKYQSKVIDAPITYSYQPENNFKLRDKTIDWSRLRFDKEVQNIDVYYDEIGHQKQGNHLPETGINNHYKWAVGTVMLGAAITIMSKERFSR